MPPKRAVQAAQKPKARQAVTAPATVSRTTRSARTSAATQIVQNTSDVSGNEEELSLNVSRAVSVVVPTRKATSTASVSEQSLSDISALGYDTPDTSVIVTPFGADKSSGRRAAVANLVKVNKKLAASTSKRSTRNQPVMQEQVDHDETLARRLQEEEYNENNTNKSGFDCLSDDELSDTFLAPPTSGPSKKSSKPAKKPLPAGLLDTDDEMEVTLGSSAPKRTPKRSATQHTSYRVALDTDEENLSSDFNVPAKRRKTQSKVSKQTLTAEEDDPDADEDDDFILNAELSDLSVSEAEVEFSDDQEQAFVPKKRKAAGSGTRSNKRVKLSATKKKSRLSKGPANRMDGATEEDDAETDRIGDLGAGPSDDDLPAAKFRRPTTDFGPKPRGIERGEWERHKLLTSHPKIKTLWDNLDKDVPVIKPVPDPQPAGINRSLKSFQLEGLNWMRRMETEGPWKGGLLGDEMGMGKTIQAVSLIMSDYPAGTPTLVVVPPVALMQWSQEISAYTDGKLKVLIYHNADPKVKNLKKADLMKYDVIMISYNGVESIHRKEVTGWKRDGGLVKENSKIHAIEYHRLVLDEAHSIKTRTTQVARACFALKSNRKWCLSGTPVQNRIGEFFSLLRFLEVKPFASYFCKMCDCEALHWAKDEQHDCLTCGHRGFDHVSLFNQELLNPITEGSSTARKEAMRKLRLITDRVMLRRLKRDHTAQMELPPKHVVIHREFFGDKERDFNRSIMTNSSRQFDTYVSRGVMLNNYANIFGLIMQMRQVANHPDLILRKHDEGGQNVLVCCICDEVAEEPIRSQCRHEFCRRCAKDYVRGFDASGGTPDCPACHIALKIDFDQPDIEQDDEAVKKSSIINRIKMENWTSSTKIELLLYRLYRLRSPKQTVKTIVFSQFTSMLQLIDWRLRRAGFSTVMLDGSMSPQQRQKSIDYFMNNVHVEVFLVSLKAGGVALNLTEANHVFIVDPWWNPAAEWQSADRVHRIGQKRPCVIHRLVIEDSVESRMVMLQEKKANMINSTVNKDDVALEKLSPEDMQFLFRGN